MATEYQRISVAVQWKIFLSDANAASTREKVATTSGSSGQGREMGWLVSVRGTRTLYATHWIEVS
jgi:hypothetical protein